MKNKKYLSLSITDKNGKTYTNPLKLSEAYLISKIAQENKSVTVTATECSPSNYKIIFG